MHTLLLAADSATTTDINYGPLLVASLIGYLLGALAFMGIFRKAGEAGWQGFVPIWSTLVMLKISGKQWWWILLLLVPIVNIVALILIYHALSQSFGHDVGFTVGLFFLSLIFFYILWLGPSTYRGPGGRNVAGTAY